MSKIKLLKIGEVSNGVQRFQSQLLVGTDTADFIIDSDGIVKHWERGNLGFNFYEFKKQYEIVSSKNDMIKQEL